MLSAITTVLSRGQGPIKAAAGRTLSPCCTRPKVQPNLPSSKRIPISTTRASHSQTTMPPQVRVGVGAFILSSSSPPNSQNPTFLLGKRLGSHGAGTYALPGGHLEFGESPEECASREILEETGLEVKNVRFLTATNDVMEEEGKHYVTMFVVCERVDKGEEARVMEMDKCEGWEWCGWEEMVRLVEREQEGKEGEGMEGERRLFQPLVDLVVQRPGVVPTL